MRFLVKFRKYDYGLRCLGLTLLILCVSSFKFPEPKSTETFLDELEANIEKVNASIETVLERLEKIDERESRPDLLMQLAELYIESSRYYYFMEREKNPDATKSMQDVDAAVAQSQKAADYYRQIIDQHPNYFNQDQTLFFLAQVLAQMGDGEGETEQLKRLIKLHPDSEFVDDAYLILGNKEFDEKRINDAAEYYEKIIALPPGSLHPVAQYKLAWVEMNRKDCKAALALFEKVARDNGNKNGEVAANAEGDVEPDKNSAVKDTKSKTSGIVREALVDSVLCYTKVKKPEEAIDYYYNLADSNPTYVAVLDKLANRYLIQKQIKSALPLYRELIRRVFDLELRIDYLQKLFGNLRQSKYEGPIDEDAKILVDTLRRYTFSWRHDEADRKEAVKTLEKYLRDAVTRLHAKARQSGSIDAQEKAARAYTYYLQAFSKLSIATAIRGNAAEAYFESKNFLKAAEYYHKTAQGTAEPRKKLSWYHSAIAAYLEALKEKDKLSKLELIQARSGFLRTANQYLAMSPNSNRSIEIRFAMGNVYFDQNEWDKSIDYFKKFIVSYPNHRKSMDAARLILESYAMKDDKDGMVNAGKAILRSGNFRDPRFRREVGDIVSRAEFKKVEDLAGSTGNRDQALATGFFQLSQKYKGTEAGEKALFNAFVSAKKANEPKQMMAAAEQLMNDYPKSSYLKQVLPAATTGMFEVGLFEVGAQAAEKYANNFGGDTSSPDLLLHAGRIRASIGDYQQSNQNFAKAMSLSQSGKKRKDIAQAYAETMSEHERWAELQNAGGLWLKYVPNDPEAFYYIAKSFFKRNRASQGTQYARMAKQQSAALPNDKRGDILAELTLLETQPLFNQYQSIALSSSNRSQEEALLTKKSQLLSVLETKYTEVAQMGSGTAAISALAKAGHLYQSFAQFLSRTGVPAGLTGAQANQYRQVMRQKVSEVAANAKNLYATCRQKAYQLMIYTHEVKECAQEKELSKDRMPSRASLSSIRPGLMSQVDLLSKQPDNVKALQDMARTYLKGKWFYSALLCLSRARELEANNATTHNLMGVALAGLNKYDEAFSSFKRSQSSAAYQNAAKICQRHGDQKCVRQMSAKVNRAELQSTPREDFIN